MIVHTAILLTTVSYVQRIGSRHPGELKNRWASILAISLFGILFSHTMQIWGLASITHLTSALPTMNDSIYFALVTYTTLGYGDVTLTAEHRIFGAMGAVTGLLGFGLSTALLVGLFTRILQEKDD